MDDRLTNAIGLAMKAGRLKTGDYAAEQTLRAGRAKLILLDETAAENTREKYRTLCESRGVETLRVRELGRWIGKPGRMIAAVTDESFTNMIRRAAGTETPEGRDARGGNDANGKK